MRHSSVNLNCRAGEDPQAGVETGASLVKTRRHTAVRQD
jgi:hypothetical protein